ncbi:MAG: response regulator [Beijerinckiaceae bacterium]
MPNSQTVSPPRNISAPLAILSQTIASHIPFLRRFSRALTGNQPGGDAYVRATLEAIVADPACLTAAGEGRTVLYRIFLKIWGSMPINDRVVQFELSRDAIAVRRNLETISLRPRIAFLLSSLEGFEVAEVAATLECTLEEAVELIATAGMEMAEQIRADVLIIEDEPLVAIGLKALVEDLGHRVVATARTHREAVRAATRTHPGLVLTDIRLADGSSGLEAVNEILGNFSMPVVFITDYPERFLTGEAPEPAFLVPKPFDVDSLKVVIVQALFFDRKARRRDESGTNSALSSKVVTGPWTNMH